jgi:hypothetical protein
MADRKQIHLTRVQKQNVTGNKKYVLSLPLSCCLLSLIWEGVFYAQVA